MSGQTGLRVFSIFFTGFNNITLTTNVSAPLIAAIYCAVIFALVGISVLEAMLLSFLIDLDSYCGKKAQRSVNAQVDIQLEADFLKGTFSAN